MAGEEVGTPPARPLCPRAAKSIDAAVPATNIAVTAVTDRIRISFWGLSRRAAPFSQFLQMGINGIPGSIAARLQEFNMVTV